MSGTEPVQQILSNLSPENIGLFLDVDGTLLDIAPRPEAVEVAASLVNDLAAAEIALGGALALVSGRPLAELDRLFAPLRLRASGIHGAEIRRQADGPVVALATGHLSDEAWSKLSRLLTEFPGSYAENKKVSFAMHYPEPDTNIDRLKDALNRLIERLTTPDQPLQLIAGNAVFEIQLCGFDKGRAIRHFMADPPFRGRKPIFLGDDKIDRPGFVTALALGGLAFSVGFELPGLSGMFTGPAAVRGWLHEIGR